MVQRHLWRVIEQAALGADQRTIISDLITVSHAEWVDLSNSKAMKTVMVRAESLPYIDVEWSEETCQYSKYIIELSASDQQRELIESYNENGPVMRTSAYYSSALDFITPRSRLRFENLDLRPFD